MVQRSKKASFKKCINCQGLILDDPGQNIVAEAFCCLECRNVFYDKFGIPSFVIINRAKSCGKNLCVIDKHLLARISIEFEVIDKK
ncbi:hypothetical protein DSECCO2_627500 [anaerobic digester metagenome]